jgi:hypothetical protein
MRRLKTILVGATALCAALTSGALITNAPTVDQPSPSTTHITESWEVDTSTDRPALILPNGGALGGSTGTLIEPYDILYTTGETNPCPWALAQQGICEF